MGHLASSVKKIEGFRFESFPANLPVKGIERLVRTAYCIYALGKNGRIYTTGELAGKVCIGGTASDYHAIEALVAFGLIDKQEAYDHGKCHREQKLAAAQYNIVYRAREQMEAAGVRLTKRQREQIEGMKAKINTQRLPWYIKLTDDQKKDIAAAKAKQGK